MPQHRRNEDSESETHQRDEDRNPLAKAARMADRYKILWMAGFGLAMWFGNRVVQPLNMVAEVAAAQTALAARVAVAEKTQADMARALAILTKIACVKNLTSADQYAFGVPCADLPARKDP